MKSVVFWLTKVALFQFYNKETSMQGVGDGVTCAVLNQVIKVFEMYSWYQTLAIQGPVSSFIFKTNFKSLNPRRYYKMGNLPITWEQNENCLCIMLVFLSIIHFMCSFCHVFCLNLKITVNKLFLT